MFIRNFLQDWKLQAFLIQESAYLITGINNLTLPIGRKGGAMRRMQESLGIPFSPRSRMAQTS